MKDEDISRKLREQVDEYVNFEYEGRKIRLPYVLDQARWRFWRSSGKGTAIQVKCEMEKGKRKKGIDFVKMSDLEIIRWLRENKIGIECSGFVYNVLDPVVKAKTGQPLAKILLRYPGLLGLLDRLILQYQRRRRISADVLTNDLNTVAIDAVCDIRAADLVRLTPAHWKGKHVAIIVQVSPDKIIYAHSSRETAIQGPHYGEIEIVDSGTSLLEQKWLEVTREGKNYGMLALHPENGDGVRRLKCLL